MTTLIHGDCIEEIPNLSADSVDVIFTSPPYYKGFEYENHFNSYKQYLDFMGIWIKQIKRVLKNDGFFLLNIANDASCPVKAYEILDVALKSWKLADTIIWFVYNRQPSPSPRTLTNQTEFIFLLKKKDHASPIHKGNITMPHEAFLTKNVGNVWKIPFRSGHKNSLKRIAGKHKGQGHGGFPEKLCELVLELFSKEGDTILDCFMGFGQLAVSCKKHNREFIGIEASPHIFKTAREIIYS